MTGSLLGPRLESFFTAGTISLHKKLWCASEENFRNFLSVSDFDTFANNSKSLTFRLFKCAVRKTAKLIVHVQYWKARKPLRGQDIAGAQQTFQSGLGWQHKTELSGECIEGAWEQLVE